MKICMVLGAHFSYAKGGAEIQADILANELIKRGHEIHYVCFGSENVGTPKKIRKDYYLYRVKRPYKNMGFLCYLNRKFIHGIMDKIKPDIIYQRGAFPFGDIISVYGRFRRIPVVSGISMEIMCKKNKIDVSLRTIPDIIDNHMRVRYFKKSDLIISQTELQKKLLKKTYGVDSIIIPNVHFVPDPPFNKKTPPIISWVANIKRLKQPEIFLKLAKELADTDANFIMAGRPACGKFQSSFENKVDALPNVTYLKEISFEGTNELIKESSIFVNTSTTEGFPNTFIQSWMRGTPVVSLNSDPNNILKNHKIGFHSKSLPKMAEDIRYLLENEEVRFDMGERARTYAVKNFDVEKIIVRYEHLLTELTE